MPVKVEKKPTDLPIVESIGLAQVAGKWIVVRLTTQGDRVLDRALLSEPEPKAFALERLRLEVVRQLMTPKGNAKA